MTPTYHQLVAAGIKPAVADTWAPHIVAACAEFGIESPREIASFIGQCAHETGGFTVLEENLNYSDVGMAGIWPARFAVQEPDPNKPGKTRAKKGPDGKNIPNAFAKALHRKPEMIANVVYSNRMGNGPVESGDGWKHRGMGLKQLTGKDNHTRCGKALGIDLVNHPELLLQPAFAARSAAWFYAENHLDKYAETWDLEGQTKKVNGGLIGIDDRKKRCNAVLACFNETAPDTVSA